MISLQLQSDRFMAILRSLEGGFPMTANDVMDGCANGGLFVPSIHVRHALRKMVSAHLVSETEFVRGMFYSLAPDGRELLE